MIKKLFFVASFSLICFFSVCAQESTTKTERNLVNDGNKLFREEKYHEALEKYEAALATNPTFQYALFNKAVTLDMLSSDDNRNTQNDPRKIAAEIFQQIASLKTNPELSAKSFYNLGNMAFNDNNFEEAIKMYKGSLRIEPDNLKCRQNLLLALQKQEEQEQNQDQQDNQDQQEQQQEQQQNQDQNNQQEQQQQQPQQQPMTQSAEQILQAMQNKENATRRRTDKEEAQPARRYTDKPW